MQEHAPRDVATNGEAGRGTSVTPASTRSAADEVCPQMSGNPVQEQERQA